MKTLIFLLAFLISSTFVFAEEFSPYIYITNLSKNNNRQYSGVVYYADEKDYYVLTCWHGINGLEDKHINLHSSVLGSSQIAFIAFKSKVVSLNEDKDLCVLSFPKVEMVDIQPLYVARDDLQIGQEAYGYGYSSLPSLIKNPLKVKSYAEYSSQLGSPLLECMGEPISGMSGGPIVYNNLIYGIQSAGNNRVLYCPSSEILKFLGN